MTGSSTRSGKGKKDATKSNIEIYLEFLNLEPKKVKLSQVFLDPNNPRTQEPGKPRVEDARIPEEPVQEYYLGDIKKIVGIDELIKSITTSGFWTTDRVVLRPLGSDKYIVVEGNRRIAALKTLYALHNKGVTLPEQVYNGIIEFEALIYKGKNPEIAWMIQGFRHTPGTEEWGDYPTSVFLATIERETGMSIPDIASTLGLKRGDVTKWIRTYYAFEQAKEDEDHGDKVTSGDFGHFHRVILASGGIKKWMKWDDKKRKFIKKENLKRYLRWATPTKKGERSRITISPRTRDTLAKLVKPEHKELFEKFDEGKMELEECEDELREEESKIKPIDVSKSIKLFNEMNNVIETLPIPKLQKAKTSDEKKQKKELLYILKNLAESIRLQIKNLES